MTDRRAQHSRVAQLQLLARGPDHALQALAQSGALLAAARDQRLLPLAFGDDEDSLAFSDGRAHDTFAPAPDDRYAAAASARSALATSGLPDDVAASGPRDDHSAASERRRDDRLTRRPDGERDRRREASFAASDPRAASCASDPASRVVAGHDRRDAHRSQPQLALPARHDVRVSDVVMRRLRGTLAAAAERAPVDFADLLMTPGLGARTVEALALAAEIVHGAPCRFSDPARFSFAHGGKDGSPFPVPLRVYDETIRVLRQAVDAARLGNDERLAAIRRLDVESRRLEAAAAGPTFAARVAHEHARSREWAGRTVLDDRAQRRAAPSRAAKPASPTLAQSHAAKPASPTLAPSSAAKLASPTFAPSLPAVTSDAGAFDDRATARDRSSPPTQPTAESASDSPRRTPAQLSLFGRHR